LFVCLAFFDVLASIILWKTIPAPAPGEGATATASPT